MLAVDLTNLQPALEPFYLQLAGRRAAAYAQVETFRRTRTSTFFEMVEESGRPYANEVKHVAGEILAQGGLTHYVNLGIGGSSLGGEAVLRALAHPFANECVSSGRFFSHYYFPDNVDPEVNAGLLDILPAERTLFHIASKSGSTAETAAQMLVYIHWLEQRLGREAARRHIVVSTDPEQGDLRGFVRDRGYRSLNIPPTVGGRFSVLGSVGLLPLALFGYDVDRFLEGGRRVADTCREPDNPALDLALALHAQHVNAQRNVLVWFGYSDTLAFVGDWFVQLWAESVGKAGRAGSTPLRAIGATDQHSQLQLFMEGPDDKVILFLRVKQPRRDIPIPTTDLRAGSTGYLMGHSLGELLAIESLATEKSLTDAGRPNAALILDQVDEASLGACFYYLQLVTVYAGALYEVNPFDQPGVEAGKRLTYGYFGRSGYEREGENLRAYLSRPRLVKPIA